VNYAEEHRGESREINYRFTQNDMMYIEIEYSDYKDEEAIFSTSVNYFGILGNLEKTG
jgi:hypothetical protein